ncbi:MAG: ISAs1 family transposase [Alphaproteobacteria bacterium]|nr:ISAs1 family transposase [Alphaproteobacteria bacterium]
MERFAACFANLEDPREDNSRHLLLDILVIGFCTILCGGEDCSDMALFGRAKEDFLRQFLRLPHGIPSHDTFSRVFRLLDPAQFQACFLRFMADFADIAHGVIAIDGKTLRRSFERAAERSPLHLVSAWAADCRLVLGQVATEAKSNEITAVPKLLEMISLKGAIVTADALNCQRTIATQVVEKGGAYVLALKGNQGTLHADVKLFLDDPAHAGDLTSHRAVEGDHGRIETREAFVCGTVGWLQEPHDWPGLAAIGKMVRTREINGATSTETAYYLLSTALSAVRFAEVVRAHWSIENGLHWVLDVTMNEDQNRSRKDHGPQNLALLRRWAMNACKLEGSKGSIKGKLKRAGWDENFLARLLSQPVRGQMR